MDIAWKVYSKVNKSDKNYYVGVEANLIEKEETSFRQLRSKQNSANLHRKFEKQIERTAQYVHVNFI